MARRGVDTHDALPDGDPASIVRRAPFADSPFVGERGQRAQVRILDAALQVFGEVGYHGCGVKRITELSGYSRASFYQYFSSKEDLFRHLAGRVAQLLNESSEALDPITPDQAGWDAFHQWLTRYSEIYDAYEPVFVTFQTAVVNDEMVASGSSVVLTRVSNDLRAKVVDSPLSDDEINVAVRALLQTVARINRESELLELDGPARGLTRARVNIAFADAYHRAFFGPDEAVNIHPSPKRVKARRGPPDTAAVGAPDDSVDGHGPAAQRTRQQLLEAGHRVFVDRGYYATRVADVVESAGVSHGVFYRYFDNKADLFRLLAERASARLAQALDGFPPVFDGDPAADDALRGWLHTYADTFAEEAAIYTMWSEATSRDDDLDGVSAAAIESYRARLARHLEPRGWGDIDADAIVLLVFLDAMTASRTTPPRLESVAWMIERGLLAGPSERRTRPPAKRRPSGPAKVSRARSSMEISYGQRIAELAAERPDDIGLIHARRDGGEQLVTWAELDRRSSQIAAALADRGAGLGDRIALRLGNSPELVFATLAAWKLGAVPVPVRWDLPDWECERVLAVVDPVVDLSLDDLPWLQATADDELRDQPDATSPQSHGICSSGSTGTPKVIVIDKPAVWDGVGAEPFPNGWIDVPRPQVIIVPAPLYHTNGFATLSSLIAGDTLVLLEKFDAARILDLIETYRVTTMTATPTMLQRIADVPGVDDRDFSSLVWVLQGAAVIGPSLVRRWIDLIGADRLYFAYGMTEGLGFAALRGDEWLDHPGSVGRGYRDTEIRILDDRQQDVPPGEIGEIFLRWPAGVLYQYLGGAHRLAVTDDGFASAGDLGHLDEDGYLFIADRRSDLIISGGANVFPAEVESALIEHPDVADVVVIGLADTEWGRRVHAIVEPRDPTAPPSPDDVIAFAKARLASYKAPKTVELIDRIPRSEATKVNRRALTEARGG